MRHRFPHERDLVHQPQERDGRVNSRGFLVRKGSVVESIWSPETRGRGVVVRLRQRRGDTAVEAEVVYDKRAERRRAYRDRLNSEWEYVRRVWEGRIDEGAHDCFTDWTDINNLVVVGQAAHIPKCTGAADSRGHGRWERPTLRRRSNRRRWTEEQRVVRHRLARIKSEQDRQTLIARSVKLDHLLSLTSGDSVGRPVKRQKAIIRRRIAPLWHAVPNLDEMSDSDLQEFANHYGRRPSRADAAALVDHRPGFTNLAKTLGRIAYNILMARKYPELTYGRIAEDMYARLPEDLQWREP